MTNRQTQRIPRNPIRAGKTNSTPTFFMIIIMWLENETGRHMRCRNKQKPTGTAAHISLTNDVLNSFVTADACQTGWGRCQTTTLVGIKVSLIQLVYRVVHPSNWWPDSPDVVKERESAAAADLPAAAAATPTTPIKHDKYLGWMDWRNKKKNKTFSLRVS